MIKTLIISTLLTRMTTGQWMPYIEDEQKLPTFAHPMPDEMLVPKDTSTNIPIIVLLKPRTAKSDRLDTANMGETVETNTDTYYQPVSDWLGVSDSDEPDTEASDEVPVRGHNDQIQWPPMSGKRPRISAEQLASIRRLLPKFAALSESNPELGDKKSGTGVAFEEAFKNFANNLTNIEHKNANRADTNGGDDDEGDGADSDSGDNQGSTENPNSGIADIPKPSANDNEDKSHTYGAQQRDGHKSQLFIPEKSTPFLNDRDSIKFAVPSLSGATANTGADSYSSAPINKGWFPLKGKPLQKHRPKHYRPKPHKYFNTDRPAMDIEMWGMPKPFPMMGAEPAFYRPPRPYRQPFSSMFEPMQGIRPQSFHKYPSFLTGTELMPTYMTLDMNADANKPQIIEPSKGEETATPEGDKQKDVIEEKEGNIDNKHIVNEKQGIGSGQGGEELIGEHMTCCDLLTGQHPGPYGNDMFKPDFDDDKLMAGIAMTGHKPLGVPPHMFEPHFEHHIPHHHKLKCHPPLQHFGWPQHVYRRPLFRPKFLYKPLFFG